MCSMTDKSCATNREGVARDASEVAEEVEKLAPGH